MSRTTSVRPPGLSRTRRCAGECRYTSNPSERNQLPTKLPGPAAGEGKPSVRTLYFLIFITPLKHCVFSGTRVSGLLYAIHPPATPVTGRVIIAPYALLSVL